MTLPVPTPQQLFQNSVNAVNYVIRRIFDENSPQSLVMAYNNCYKPIFANPNGTAADALQNIGTSSASTLSVLSAIRTLLVTEGVLDLPEIPAYTANDDGTVTLTQ